jgi:peptidoglycan/LPS O-acetylase OafA/YrhL
MKRKRERTPAEEVADSRTWLLIVAALIFGMDVYWAFFGAESELLDATTRAVALGMSGLICASFVAAWWYAKRRPRPAFAVALAIFWALQIVIIALTVGDGGGQHLGAGLALKIIFTLVMVKGIRAAGLLRAAGPDVSAVFD